MLAVFPAKCSKVPDANNCDWTCRHWSRVPRMSSSLLMLGHLTTLCRACTGKHAPRCLNWSLRSLSTSRQLVEVSTEGVGKFSVASVSLNHPPVNSFNTPLTIAVTDALRDLEDSGKVDAIVIKSSVPNVFSAGLDLKELHGVSEKRLKEFWNHFQDLWLQLYSSKLTTVAAISGHCLAAGTILSSSCDYRVAVEGRYSLGVTAAKIGVIAPPWFLKMLTYLMGQRNTEMFLQQGRVFLRKMLVQLGWSMKYAMWNSYRRNVPKLCSHFWTFLTRQEPR